MESGAKGCEVVVSGKLRAARAKSMKFTVSPPPRTSRTNIGGLLCNLESDKSFTNRTDS